MGISFKVSKTGTRFRPKPIHPETSVSAEEDDVSLEATKERNSVNEPNSASARKLTGSVVHGSEDATGVPDNGVSFALSLFLDGYSIGKPSENEYGHQASENVPRLLHPYDRASETLFSAIESGRLPGDILEDIPCKYVDGALVCEVRDYRRSFPEAGQSVPSSTGSPIVTRVCLKMSLENVVKDIPLISDNAWTYGDMMEVESRILRALQPQLCLDPSPKLDRLCNNPASSKLTLGIGNIRRRRLRQMAEVIGTSNDKTHGKNVGIDRVPESCRSGDTGVLVPHPGNENLNTQNNMRSSYGADASVQQPKYQMGVVSPRMMQDHRSSSVASPEMMPSYADAMNATLHGKRENHDGQASPLSNLSKRARFTHMTGADSNLHVDGFHTPDLQWKSSLLQPHSVPRGTPYGNTSSMLKYPQQMFENQEGIKYNLKEEPAEIKNEMQQVTESDMDSRLKQKLPQQQLMMRSGFQQTPWNALSQALSPRGGLPQSPLSSKSGEFSNGSVGAQQYSAAVNSGLIQKPSAAPAGSMTSSANDSMQRQAHIPAKRRTGSVPKNPVMSGVGSPASVSTMSLPINASSPPVGSSHSADQIILERFSKVEMLTTRFQLNPKKCKVEEYPSRKPNVYPTQQLHIRLSNNNNNNNNDSNNNENVKDEPYNMPLSKSLVGGSTNVCKTRVLTFMQTERVLQGHGFQYVPKVRTRMIMSEKPNDGTVAIHIGEMEDAEYLNAEDYLPTLPNTHFADLLAAQFCSLMVREGHHVEDHIQPKPVRMNRASSNQTNVQGMPPNGEMMMQQQQQQQQYSDGVSSQLSNELAKQSNVMNSSAQNMQGQRVVAPGNAQALHMSQGQVTGVSRPQQSDPLAPQQNQHHLMQQQHQQLQRSSSLMLPSNPIAQLNTVGQSSMQQLGNQIGNNKASPMQMQQILQQPQQQQQSQSQMQQRKMMMGLGNVGGLGNISNNIAALGGLGNVMGLGGLRGVGGTGISAPLGGIAGIGNTINLNQASISNAISQQLRSGALTPQQALLMQNKLRLAHNRSNLGGNPSPQSSIGGLTGIRQQMHPGSTGFSVLGSLNRANINPMQRTAVGPMGPPKLMAGINPYMNPQQQMQLQQQMQQQQQQQQQQQVQQQQLQQQLETASPLQAVVSPPQVGSPSQHMNQNSQQAQQQQASPQQMNQRTPLSPQMSSGAIHGNPEACPASPQLSSQTLGSVGSMTNSPMELQGVNKTNNA